MTSFDQAGAEQLLVFTDLDGSLLDHDTYSYAAASAQLRRLAERGIPVIPVSSKTRAEIETLRDEIGLAGPFIAENGAAAYIPEGYFAEAPEETAEHGPYRVKEWSRPRSDWLDLLTQLRAEFEGEFEHFEQMGVEGIVAATGLEPADAERANRREYSEPVRWLGSDARRSDFIARLEAAGARVLQGGRFLAVAGDCDKGRALEWLRTAYAAARPGVETKDIALGDSGNDVAMLEAAGTAVLVRSPTHPFPILGRSQGIIRTDAFGPAGWAEAIEQWLTGHERGQ